MNASQKSIKTDRHSKIFKNATRLIADASFLNKNNRHASAFALALLGIEEVGKIILDIWYPNGNIPKQKALRSFHIQKQYAVAALMLGKQASVFLANVPMPDRDASELKEQLAKLLYEGEEGQFSRHVLDGILDKTKHCAMYFDDQFEALDIRAEQFEHSDVTELLDLAVASTEAIFDNRAMRAGKAIYGNQSHSQPPKAI
ncbi:MAG: AbiV family abortive infection protein [Pseudomonadota bacterium]|nr:AbiV family abortive infection protein [Pseudomonadota bacterium]